MTWLLCRATQWTNAITYADNPIGIIVPNWSNDSCLPPPHYPCSGKGFPIYVVNASCAAHVAAGIEFAKNSQRQTKCQRFWT